MELRHLRYFVAVAEEGNLTSAATKRLHTAQPSLSRQLRDLELEVGAELFVRKARGVELTPAGAAFLDQARLALSHAQEAVAAARRAARPAKKVFSVGFLTGQEADWLPSVTGLLRHELPNIEFKVISLQSPSLADAIQRGDVDLGFLRVEPRPDVHYEVVAKEPLLVIMPNDHRLASVGDIDPAELARETFIGCSEIPHVLRDVIAQYFASCNVQVSSSYWLDDYGTGISLISSTRGVAILPAYVEPLLPWTIVSRQLKGTRPTIDLAVGYRTDNPSPILKTFLENIEQIKNAGPGGSRRRSDG
ncbi:LysR family transcriptional regulator, hca operon transcriptional activator [Pseudomonas sp. NFACC32-1]|uniref:LysR family transcriptional regulator n=2 Tax=Pseudomonas TaxID=286 RepID=UPI000876F4E3|nr:MULTISPECIES: LysR family transcriptional regulator [unclassified Pseudomonas]SCX66022.1 LysR family transcriptional regulator, hca operon transcriptional activator [Pseudomonas sp. NFACC32-1]SFX76344.1 LysR family transcriptional regulator, hca operon transcriptional activator [Pseudomonas sp. NFACC49-2]